MLGNQSSPKTDAPHHPQLFRIRLRSFLLILTAVCLALIAYLDIRSTGDRNKKLELLGGRVLYDRGELWYLGQLTPTWIRDHLKQPIEVEVDCTHSPRETLAFLGHLKSIQKLQLSLRSGANGKPLELPFFPNLRELDLRYWDDDSLRLASLGQVPNLESLKLPLDINLSDSFLLSLPRMPKLSYLLINVERINNAGLQALEQTPALSELHIMNASSEILEYLPQVNSLRRLEISFASLISRENFVFLKSFPHLEELAVSASGPHTIANFPRFERLRKFTGFSLILSQTDIRGLSHMPNLLELEFIDCEFHQDSFDDVFKLEELTTLSFSGCSFPLICLPKLSQWDSIRRLNLDFQDSGSNKDLFGDKYLENLPVLGELNELSINGWVSVRGLHALGKFKNIKTIEFAMDLTNVVNNNCTNRKPINSVIKLLCADSRLANDGLQFLSLFPNVRELDLSSSDVDDSQHGFDRSQIDWYPHRTLETLKLDFTSINDSDLFQLHHYPNLRFLSLRGCERISLIPSGWASKLLHLRQLNLDFVPLCREQLAELSECPNLRNLSLLGSSVALEDLPYIPTLQVVRLDCKKQTISTSFPFPILPPGLRIEVTKGLYSDREEKLIDKNYPLLTIVESD